MGQKTFYEEKPGILPFTPVTHETRLSSSEIANLWRTCMFNSMHVCILNYFLQHVRDRELKSLLEDTRSASEVRVSIAADFLRKDGRVVPAGFGDQDIDLEAPALFSDVFKFLYLKNSLRGGLNVAGMACTMAARPDIIEFFKKVIDSILDLWVRLSNTMLNKGIFIKPPYVTTVEKIDYMKKQDLLGALLGQDRSLLTVEIEQLFFGITANEVGRTLLTGFRQTARSSDVRDFMERGLKLASDYIKIFTDKLNDGDIGSPMNWDSYGNVTESTVPPFSDRLMMYHTYAAAAEGMVNYGVSMSSCMRGDIIAGFTKISAETASYTADGIKLMIDNGWFEEPPRVLDRDKLFNLQKH